MLCLVSTNLELAQKLFHRVLVPGLDEHLHGLRAVKVDKGEATGAGEESTADHEVGLDIGRLGARVLALLPLCELFAVEAVAGENFVDLLDEDLLGASSVELANVDRRLLAESSLLLEDSHLQLGWPKFEGATVDDLTGNSDQVSALLESDSAAEVRSSPKLNRLLRRKDLNLGEGQLLSFKELRDRCNTCIDSWKVIKDEEMFLGYCCQLF